MKTNYGYEYAKFRAEQKKQRENYLSLGMAEEAIEEIEKFDKEEFLRTLAYKRNTISFDLTTPFETNDESKNPLYNRNIDKLTVTIETYRSNDRYEWIEQIENPEMYSVVIALSPIEKEILTLYVFEGLTQEKIKLIPGITQQAISKKIKKIKKKFERRL